ncbi:hypothetical protein [Neobacillus sp. D3-1R]|uniref:hypothetical protein n=1 Tax=Neobacillus sp. D3-1R TaxID=3445778 RepID=UPI003F9EBB42
MKKSYLLLIILVVLAGCSSGMKGNENVDVNHNAVEFMSYGHQNKDQVVDKDKDRDNFNKDEVTEQNPNFLNLNTDNETHVNNQGIKVNKIKDIVKKSNKFEAGPVWTNGQDMFVTVYPKGRLTAEERNAAKTQLRKDLVRALPTYHIEVRVKNR